MPTNFPDIFQALADPFRPDEVKLRNAPGGRSLHYITARTAMNRLDVVLGPENWWDEYLPSENSVQCRLTIRLPDGSTVTKADAGGYAGMADQGDDDKSGFSDAFKRAAAKFGVGRYLYRDGVPSYVEGRIVSPSDLPPDPSPQRPAPAPQQRPLPGVAAPQGQRQAPSGGGNYGNLPRSGAALFAWAKNMEKEYGVGLIKYLDTWAKLNEFPGHFKSWSDEQVALGVAEACRKLDSIAGAKAAPEPAASNGAPEPAASNGAPADDEDDPVPF